MTEPASDRDRADLARQVTAVELRRCGHAFVEIAQRLGYVDGDSARLDVRAWLARDARSPVDQIRDAIRDMDMLRLAILRTHPYPSASFAKDLRDLDKTRATFVYLLRRYELSGGSPARTTQSERMTADGRE
jgi:hypothetical protein